MRATDRIARFVGLEAYEAVGGRVTRDLFNDEDAYIDDPALMTRIAGERLDVVRSDLLAKGWGWVNIHLGVGRLDGGSSERIHPTRRAMTDEERAALAALDAEVEALDELLEDADDEDERWSRRDDLAAQRYALLESTQDWDGELMKLAGVVVSLDHDGRPSFAYGIVAKDDAPKVRRIRKDRESKAAREHAIASPAGEEIAGEELDESTAPWDECVTSLPKALTRELTEARTRALRCKLSETPDLALALTVFALSRRHHGGYAAPGVGVDLRPAEMSDDAPLAEAHAALGEVIPADLVAALDWLIAQPRQTLLECLAVMVAGAIDLSHDGASREDARKQQIADRLAVALDLDMTRHWRPDMAFWSRLSKSALIDIHLTAPALADLSEPERTAFQKAQTKRTKDDIAKAVAQALDGVGWLPEVLVTPDARGAFDLTEQGRAAIAAE